jgi:outer membrane protein
VSRVLLCTLMLSAAAVAQEQPPPPPPQSLSLEQAVQIALQRNPDLQRQVVLTLSAEQDKVIARSAILPNFGFNGSWTSTRQGGGVTIIQNKPFEQTFGIFQAWQAGVTLRQLVFDGGKWWNNMAASGLAYQSNVAQTDEQRLQITYLVEQRFYELIRAQRQLQVFGEAATRSRDQANYTQRLFEGGRATQADVYAARANRDNDEVTRLGQERNVELARADLALAIGVDPSEPLTVAEPPGLLNAPAQPPPAKDAVARALETRPSIKAASLTVESNRKAASAAGGDYWPAVSLTGGYSRSSERFGDLFKDPAQNSTLFGGVNLAWNVFNGLSTQANVRKAQIQTLLSQNDLENARRNVASDVEKAVAQLGTARAQARVAQQAEQTAREGLRLARTRQEVGVGTQLEVRDAELKLTQAQLNVVGSLVDGREAEAALRRAQGGT